MRFRFIWTLSLILALSPMAHADVPPPEGYVEACTVAKQQTANLECLQCRAWESQPYRCVNFLVPYCYTQICTTWKSTSTWYEVYCRKVGGGAPDVPAEILARLTMPDANETYSPEPAVAPSSCASHSPTGGGSNGGSGCRIGPDRAAIGAFGALASLFVGLAFVRTLRRSRR